MRMGSAVNDLGSPLPPKLEDGVATERVQIIAPQSWLEHVEEWRRKQPKIANRSDAIRQLVDKAGRLLVSVSACINSDRRIAV